LRVIKKKKRAQLPLLTSPLNLLNPKPEPYRVTSLIRNRRPPKDHHMALGIGLL